MSFVYNYSSSFSDNNFEEKFYASTTNLFAGITHDNPNLIPAYELLGEKINQPLPNGELPLHFAIRKGSIKVVDILLQHSLIDISKKDDQGLTALDHLFLTSDEEFKTKVLGLFFERSTKEIQKASKEISTEKIDTISKNIHKTISDHNDPQLPANPIYVAVQRGDLNAVRMAIEKGEDINAQSATGQTVLHVAIQLGEEYVVKGLIDQKADVNLTANNGISPLHLAAISGNINMMNMLIRAGASLDATDHLNCTPLHYAIFGKNDSFANARFLIENGADPVIKTPEIPSPLALMINLAQQQSTVRDPLKVDLLQQLLCVCSLLGWIQSMYGNEADLSAFVIQHATSFLFSAMTVDQLLKVYNASDDLKSFIKSGASLGFTMLLSAFDSVPYLGEAALVFKTYMTAQSVWQGISSAWRNRWLAPAKSLKLFSVNCINASFNLKNVYQRVEKCYHTLSAKAYLDLYNCKAALEHASAIQKYPLRDETLLAIANRCSMFDLSTAEEAVNMIKTRSLKDAGMANIFNTVFNKDFEKSLAIFNKMDGSYVDSYKNTAFSMIKDRYLSQGKYKELYELTEKITRNNEVEIALKDIASNSNCVAKDSKFTFKAAEKIMDTELSNQAFVKLSGNLVSLGKCQEALEAAEKIRLQKPKVEALMKVISNPNCLENHTNVALQAAAAMPKMHEQPEKAWMIILEHYLRGNHYQDALAITEKFEVGEARDESLKSIFSHENVRDNPDRKLEVISKFHSTEAKDAALPNLIKEYLDLDRNKNALEALKLMHDEFLRDKELKKMLNHSSVESFLDTEQICFEASEKMRGTTFYDSAIKFLNTGKHEEALKFVVNVSDEDLKHNALNKIFDDANFYNADVNLNVLKNSIPQSKQQTKLQELFKTAIDKNEIKFGIKLVDEIDKEFLEELIVLDKIKQPEMLLKILETVDPLKRDGLAEKLHLNQVSNFLELEECEKALKLTENLNSVSRARDNSFKEIATNAFCLQNHPKISLRAALNIADEIDRNNNLIQQTEIHLENENFKYAVQSITNIGDIFRPNAVGKFITNKNAINKHWDLIIELVKNNREISSEHAQKFAIETINCGKANLLIDNIELFSGHEKEIQIKIKQEDTIIKSVVNNKAGIILEEIISNSNCARDNPDLILKAFNLISFKGTDEEKDVRINKIVDLLLGHNKLLHALEILNHSVFTRYLNLVNIKNYFNSRSDSINEQFFQEITQSNSYSIVLKNLDFISNEKQFLFIRKVIENTNAIATHPKLIFDFVKKNPKLIDDDVFVSKILLHKNEIASPFLESFKLVFLDKGVVGLKSIILETDVVKSHPQLVFDAVRRNPELIDEMFLDKILSHKDEIAPNFLQNLDLIFTGREMNTLRSMIQETHVINSHPQLVLEAVRKFPGLVDRDFISGLLGNKYEFSLLMLNNFKLVPEQNSLSVLKTIFVETDVVKEQPKLVYDFLKSNHKLINKDLLNLSKESKFNFGLYLLKNLSKTPDYTEGSVLEIILEGNNVVHGHPELISKAKSIYPELMV